LSPLSAERCHVKHRLFAYALRANRAQHDFDASSLPLAGDVEADFRAFRSMRREESALNANSQPQLTQLFSNHGLCAQKRVKIFRNFFAETLQNSWFRR
jgi:hypothetical protein